MKPRHEFVIHIPFSCSSLANVTTVNSFLAHKNKLIAQWFTKYGSQRVEKWDAPRQPKSGFFQLVFCVLHMYLRKSRLLTMKANLATYCQKSSIFDVNIRCLKLEL